MARKERIQKRKNTPKKLHEPSDKKHHPISPTEKDQKDFKIIVKSTPIDTTAETDKVRIDGRDASEERHLLIEFFRDSILLRKYTEIENTENIEEHLNCSFSSSVILYPTVEIKKPSINNPRKGIFTFYSNDKRIQSEIENIFSRSEILSLDKLSIIPKKAVISIRIDILVVNDKGGLIELITEGIYQCLCRIKIDQKFLKIDRKIGQNHLEIDLLKNIKDFVNFHPKTTTLCSYNKGILLDPTEEEIAESDGSMIITQTICKSHSNHSVLTSHKDIIYWSFVGEIKYSTLLDTIHKILASN